ncbi:MAG: SUMF1/EgtB/PvdO family nonheme iron enzyme [Candidatus Latescibacteria bacterium]|nr:SUMF1/EgtB/PvdO family nonheme iron enzyme [Candidatus Latescibacterota bacterium]
MRSTPRMIVVGLCLWACLATPAAGQPAEAASAQTHIEAAVAHYQRREWAAAKMELQAALSLQKKSALAHHWFGMVALQEGKKKDAERSFQRAASLDRKLAEPYNGLGLLYRSMKNRKIDAISAFKRALELNPAYADAQYNLATAYLDINVMNVFPLTFTRPLYSGLGRQALQKTLDLNPDHPDANYALGVIYEVELNNPDKAIPFYVRQLQVNPDRVETLKRLGVCYFKTRQYQDGVNVFTALVRQHPALETTTRPIMAMLQASAAISAKQYERAAATYEEYLQTLPGDERAVYEDLTAVASESERREYQSLPEPAKAEYRRQFWKQRDSDPTTLVNERLIEHYRRVTFARFHFGERKSPWDRRGEIYVRYGDPDDRQAFVFSIGERQADTKAPEEWAGFPRTTRTIAEGIREKAQASNLERSAFAPTGNARVDAIREMNQQLRYQLSVEASTIGLSAYRVESWVYVPMGVELFFVDQLGNGMFDYPLPTEPRNIVRAARQAEYHPEKLAREMIKKVPEYYRYDYGGELLRFFFDAVTFRGSGNKSAVEVAFAVPMNQLGAVSDGKGAQTSLESRVTMTNAEWEDAASAATQFGPFTRPASIRPKEAGTELTTFQLPVSALPGEYTIAVSVRDAATRRVGIYRQPVMIPSYSSNQLMMSDIKLASSISPTVKSGPFVRHRLEIVPNPTRTFAVSRPVYVYYELYNLRQDGDGKTNFKTDVTVTARQEQQALVWRILSGFGRLVEKPDQDKALTFSILDASASPTEARYTALDLSGSPPGRYTVEIAVTDLNTNRTVKKTSEFVVTADVAEKATQASRWRVSGQDSTAEAAAPEDSIVVPVLASSIPPDSGAASGGMSELARPSWNDLLRILQSPQYTVGARDSLQRSVTDSAVGEFLSGLTESLNEQPGVGSPGEGDEYKDMVYVPAGPFWMGGDSTNADERPFHQVSTEAFYVDRYEVTNAQYKRFLEATGHTPPRHWLNGEYPPGEARYPVVGVSWYDADAYAKWAGKRLPSEAEWEKAARGTDGRLYPWGDEFRPERLNVGGNEDSYETTSPVGSFPEGVSPYGVLDMGGNVWEWTTDWYGPYPGNLTPNPAYGEQYRVIRGGSWMNYDLNTRASNRGKYYPSDTSLLLGFRCAREPKAARQKPRSIAAGGTASSVYGYLLVVTPGTWADVYVDGEKLGQTPQADPLRLTVGTHLLLLTNPFYHEYRREVVIQEDALSKERAVMVRK